MEDLRQSKPLPRSKKSFMHDELRTYNFNWPLSDSEIIIIQKMFMTSQVHHISTRNITSGRVLMSTILKSFQYYNFIGCLTTSKILLDDDIASLYELLQEYNKVSEFDPDKSDLGLQEFLTYFHFDFIWIELTVDLLKIFSKPKIQELCQLLTQYEPIPVVLISYQN
ncbi:MAG TPA: hypothetical protein VLG50_03530 [Candidatus Saccharimonadales bacterium]|nr:hypothetical protein [Candidatus Saccharimonadales bacterium]